MKEMGIGMAMSPGNIHQAVGMDFPISMGGYEYTKTPDDPCILHMRCCLLGESVGSPQIEQYREARYRMLSMDFRDYETEYDERLILNIKRTCQKQGRKFFLSNNLKLAIKTI